MLLAERVRLSFRDSNGRPFTALSVDRFAPKSGEITAIGGPSGSGKTSLLYVIAGLLPPQEGTVSHDGTCIYSIGEGRRTTIGFVFQEFYLVPELSVAGNIDLPATFGGSRRGRARDLLTTLGVPMERRSVDELSRGERQRVAIARALYFDPPIVLADELTASLDEESAGEVRGVFRKLAAEGRTVVAVTHDRALLSEADTAIRLERGAIVSEPERVIA